MGADAIVAGVVGVVTIGLVLGSAGARISGRVAQLEEAHRNQANRMERIETKVDGMRDTLGDTQADIKAILAITDRRQHER
jgi:hypothetical protein